MNQNNSISARIVRANQCALWTALVTPFNQDGKIDYASLKAIASEQAQEIGRAHV